MKKNNSGMTLIEILVALSLFVVIATLVNQAFFATLRGSSKSKITTKLKQEGNYAVSVMERSLHSASSFVNCTSQSVTYMNERGVQSVFSCSNGIINKDGSALTATDVNISCNISCPVEGGMPTVILDLSLSPAGSVVGLRAEETANVDIKTRIRFRN